SPRRGKGAIGHVDGDALLALGLQAIDQRCHVEVAAGRAEPRAVAGKRRDLIVEQKLAVVEEAPEQGRLAVIDRPASEKTQKFSLSRRHTDCFCGFWSRLLHQK